MEQRNYQHSSEELDVKSILKQLAFGVVAGLAFIAVCGLGEFVANLFNK